MAENDEILYLVTPCCGDKIGVNYGWEGQAYMQIQVADGFFCTAPGCYNEWDTDGRSV